VAPVSDVTIRAEHPEDAAAIREVVAAAFGSPAEAALVDDIRASAGFFPELSLVAELGGTIVGHVMVSAASLVDGEETRTIANLSPLAVHPDAQGRGIGGALLREVVARANARGEPLIVLEGDPGYYGRFGFEPSVPRGIDITLPSWAPPEAAQVIRLASYDPTLRGQVVYPAAFDGVIEH
jgi:putative acetyltransferase